MTRLCAPNGDGPEREAEAEGSSLGPVGEFSRRVRTRCRRFEHCKSVPQSGRRIERPPLWSSGLRGGSQILSFSAGQTASVGQILNEDDDDDCCCCLLFDAQADWTSAAATPEELVAGEEEDELKIKRLTLARRRAHESSRK